MRINLTTFLTSTATKITNDDDHSTTENSRVERAASTSNCRAVRNIKSLLYEEDHGTELFSAITWIL